MEVWKSVKDYEGRYEVSNFGRVKSLNSLRHKAKLLKLLLCRKGYSKISLFKKENGKNISKQVFVHRLVAQVFLVNNENKAQVNHINGIKTDNRVENLEWCTSFENMQHSVRTGLKKPCYGEKAANARFSNKQADEIRRNFKKGVDTFSQVSRDYNVSRNVIACIIQNKTYTNA